MKVFLSHSIKDKQLVQTLAAELEAAKIEEGLRDADLSSRSKSYEIRYQD
jgi:hypothetical protein